MIPLTCDLSRQSENVRGAALVRRRINRLRAKLARAGCRRCCMWTTRGMEVGGGGREEDANRATSHSSGFPVEGVFIRTSCGVRGPERRWPRRATGIRPSEYRPSECKRSESNPERVFTPSEFSSERVLASGTGSGVPCGDRASTERVPTERN